MTKSCQRVVKELSKICQSVVKELSSCQGVVKVLSRRCQGDLVFWWLPLDVVVPLVEADARDVVLVEEHLEEVGGCGLVTEDDHLPPYGQVLLQDLVSRRDVQEESNEQEEQEQEEQESVELD